MSTPDYTDEWDSFNDLVTWACWEILQAITSGKPLRGTVHHLLEVARRAKFKPRPTGHKES